MPRRPGADDLFFPAMALLILGFVVGGFAQSYFLAGMVRAKLPNALVHIHAALFISWIFLLVFQTTLAAAGKVRWHMRLGILGAVLPPLLVVFGAATLFDSIRRGGVGPPPEILLVGDLEELALFAGLTAWAMLARRDAATHKRLMILGTMAMLGPAIDRLPLPFGLIGTIVIYVGLPLLVVAYDLWSRRRIHRSTAMAYAMIAIGMLTLLPLSSLGIWQQCLTFIRQA
jgi:hypothetical protein